MPTHIAGTEIYVAALSKSLERMGVQTVIVKPGFDKNVIEEYVYNNQRVIEYPQSSFNNKGLITGNIQPSGLPYFQQVLKQENPDIIHFHEISGSNGITKHHMEIAEALNIPFFTTLHLVGYVCKTGMLLYKNKTHCNGIIKTYKCAVCTLHNRGAYFGLAEIAAATGFLIKKNKRINDILPKPLAGLLSYPLYIDKHRETLHYIFSQSKKVFVLSSWFKEVLLRNSLPENKMTLLEKALPHQVQIFKIGLPETKSSQLVRIIYLGRISKIKGLHLLIKALNIIKCNNWQLDIYGQTGEYEYEQSCKKMARKKSDNIVFKNVLQPNQVLDVLQGYDVLVCPTIIEEMVGLVVMEAFAAGVPVIGSDTRGISEQVRDGIDGFLFRSGSLTSIVNLLQKILNEPFILQNLKKNIIIPQSFDLVAQKVYDEYSFVLEKKKSV